MDTVAVFRMLLLLLTNETIFCSGKATISKCLPQEDSEVEIMLETLNENTELYQILATAFSSNVNGDVAKHMFGILDEYSWFWTSLEAQIIQRLWNTSSRISPESITSVIPIHKEKQRGFPYMYGVTLNVIDTIISKLNWTDLIIVHDNNTGGFMDDLSVLLSYGNRSFVRYNLDVVFSKEAILDVLSILYESLKEGVLNFLVVCQFDCVRRIIHQADSFDNISKNYRRTALYRNSRWFIASTITDDGLFLEDCISNLDNVAFIDIDSLDSAESFEHGSFEARTLLWTRSGRKFTSAAIRRNMSGIQIDSDILFPNTKLGFNGRTLIVTTLWWPPFTNKTILDNVTYYHGYCMDLLDELSRVLNFSYKIVEPADNEWGMRREDGSWTGMIGLLENREVDLMVAAASIQEAREQVMDFTYPFFFDTSTFMMRRPDQTKHKWRMLLDPIEWSMILSIVLCVPVTASIIFCLEKLNPYYSNRSKTSNAFKNVLGYIFRAMMYQGGVIPTKTQAGRTVLASWWLFTFLIVSMYTAHLAAERTVHIHTKIKTFDELASQKEYKWGVLGGTYFVTLFSHSLNPAFQKIWKGIEEFNRSDPSIMNKDANAHVQKVLNEDYAFIEAKVFMELVAAQDCRILLADEEFANMKYGIGLPNKSPYTKLFSDHILQMTESGMPEAWRRKNWPKQTLCEGLNVIKAKTLSIADMQGAFYILICGFGLGLIMLTLECVIKRNSIKKQLMVARKVSVIKRKY